MARLGALVVGQSPRHDVEAELRAVVGPGVDVELRGTLDGLDRGAIDRLRPRDAADTLFTRLPCGDGVRLSKAAVVEHGEHQLAALAAAGYDVTMVLCTGEFPQWMARYRVVFPSRVMDALVRALLPEGRLGVLAPLPEQAAQAEARWRAAGHDATVVPLSPNAGGNEVRIAARELASSSPDLVVLDCMSYTSEAKRIARETTGVPAVLAVTAVARCALELVR